MPGDVGVKRFTLPEAVAKPRHWKARREEAEEQRVVEKTAGRSKKEQEEEGEEPIGRGAPDGGLLTGKRATEHTQGLGEREQERNARVETPHAKEGAHEREEESRSALIFASVQVTRR
jgi:hypothetical protein